MRFQSVASQIAASNPGLLTGARNSSQTPVTIPETGRWGRNGARYINRESGRRYQPHHREELDFVRDDRPRRWLLKGGEGSGKSVAGIVKDLERLRRGMSGIMGSPTLVHFRKSLWPEFRRWCPLNAVIPSQRYRLDISWQPNQPFELVFEDMGWGHATLLCGGFDSPGSWEGPNVNFAHIDEGRHLSSPAMAKVLDGRCRIAGSDGSPPQWWVTTTPRKTRLPTSPEDEKYHWLYQMFGPWEDDGEDPFADFKAAARVTTLRLEDNAPNLAEGFVEERVQSLTAKETRILAHAEWEDEEDTERFLPNMVLWDSLQLPIGTIPPLSGEPLVVALDAATGRKTTTSDCFGMVAVAPRSYFNLGSKGCVVRYVEKWQAAKGQQIQYSTPMGDGPGDRIRWLIDNHNVTCVTFDPHQLVFVAQALEQEGKVWVEPYNQGTDRLVSDRHLYDQIIQKEATFDPGLGGLDDLRAHIDNADRKVDADKHNFRLVQGRGKIDLAVCLSMASKQLSELNL